MFQKSTFAKLLIPLTVIVLAVIYGQISKPPQSNQNQKHFMLNARNILQKTLSKTRNMSTVATITPRRSGDRGHADHGWLNTYHSFSFADYQDPRYMHYGSLRVLNEDRVAPNTGFPTHPHRDFEIFSYILSGELTHRDSVKGRGGPGASKDDFYVMKRGDVQFSTAGTGLRHSEQNENLKDWVHFLQIWVHPWAKGLPPIYHTSTFTEEDKRKGFVALISPLKAGPKATAEQEKEATPSIEGTIPIHADFLMGASIIAAGTSRAWKVGGGVVQKQSGRRVYIHLPATKGGKSQIKLAGKAEVTLGEGDGAFVDDVNDNDELIIESIGTGEAEVVVLDSD